MMFWLVMDVNNILEKSNKYLFTSVKRKNICALCRATPSTNGRCHFFIDLLLCSQLTDVANLNMLNDGPNYNRASFYLKG